MRIPHRFLDRGVPVGFISQVTGIKSVILPELVMIRFDTSMFRRLILLMNWKDRKLCIYRVNELFQSRY